MPSVTTAPLKPAPPPLPSPMRATRSMTASRAASPSPAPSPSPSSSPSTRQTAASTFSSTTTAAAVSATATATATTTTTTTTTRPATRTATRTAVRTATRQAQPARGRRADPATTVPAPRPLTIPKTPAFSQRLTARSRAPAPAAASAAGAARRPLRASTRPPQAPRRPARGPPPLTKPQPFTFHTTARHKPAAAVPASPPPPPPPPPPVRALRNRHGLTQTAPFTFHATTRRTLASDGNDRATPPATPLAERIQRFENETPERFARVAHIRARERIHAQLTKPQSPRLATRVRATAHAALAPRQPSADAAAAAPPRFKAQPVNPQILYGRRPLGVPPPVKAPLTVARTPCITRPRKRRADALAADAADPLPPPPPPFRANPMPDAPPFVPVLPHTATRPEPFALPGDARRAEQLRRFAAQCMAEAVQAEQARRFRAQPAATRRGGARLPPVLRKPPTAPAPFALSTDLRGAMHAQVLAEKLRLEQERTAEARAFQAQPLPEGPAFVPRPSVKPLTATAPPALRTTTRAAQRHEFDEAQRARIADEAAAAAREAEAAHLREMEAVRQLRQDGTFHAQPVRKYAPVPIRKSTKRLTVPKTPNFKLRPRR
ncbi:hypothetical protein CXG81DRAFT_17841 [Caulochytrium protostelioides]|uniref:TPX2 C-terminal domain-containing protein n=1 Tax=Caulochytrium protostelioides TaxID=1555241 RepID=A0A4P9XAS4_9FUNG|nr:hypothetical protein CXG81DRAFT_17841 [Caulochytrium protostelioides]|eukprot:RKP02477.1 hypothetical protein CXG81DRAFT_17841 [Caulochytrium protostelioides]